MSFSLSSCSHIACTRSRQFPRSCCTASKICSTNVFIICQAPSGRPLVVTPPRREGRTPEKYEESYTEMAVVGGSGSKEWKGRDVIIGGRKANHDVFSEHSTCRHIKEGTLTDSSIGSRGA